MGYSEIDQLAINTIRLLAVCSLASPSTFPPHRSLHISSVLHSVGFRGGVRIRGRGYASDKLCHGQTQLIGNFRHSYDLTALRKLLPRIFALTTLC
jgi:hypothetical protein